MSFTQGWPISFGVQSLLGFLAPFEIGYNEGQITTLEQKKRPLYYRIFNRMFHGLALSTIIQNYIQPT